MKLVSFIIVLSIPCLVSAKIWEVGMGKLYTKPSAVSALVNDADTVFIQADEYIKDVCIWRANNLRLIGVGGKAHLNAQKTAYGGKAIWVIAGNNTYVENIEFSNCEVVDLNGAGIRLEGQNLTVHSCYFHNNQDGILAGDNADSDVIVEYSEFAYNGAGDGYSHNIYINHLKSLLFQYNYVHHAFYGHEVKSRAYQNIIIYNRITNEDGNASYEIDLPNGGPTLVMGNIIQQSHYSDNNTIISYAREGLTNPGPHNLYFVNNTVVNNEDGGTALNIQSNTDTVFNVNNIFAGPMNILLGIPKTYIKLNNVINSDLSYFHFISDLNYDYHLTPGSPGIDSALIINQNYLGYSLIPTKEYVHPAWWKPRVDDQRLDIGAYELQQITRNQDAHQKNLAGYFDELSKTFILTEGQNPESAGNFSFNLFNSEGKRVIFTSIQTPGIVKLTNLETGKYYYSIGSPNKLLSGSFVITH